MKASRASFELGVTRFFGIGDIGPTGLQTGWAAPEDAHSWNDGFAATMELDTQTSPERYAIEFEGRPFINDQCRTQEVYLYCNGFLSGFWKLDEPTSHTLSVVIEPEQIFNRDDHAFARLVWLLPNSIRPSDINLNNDGRRLGFCFHALTIRDADADSIE